MYFKCTLSNGTEVYKALDDDALKEAVNYEDLEEIIYEARGERIEDNDWDFTDVKEPHSDIVDVDLRKILNIDDIFKILSEDIEILEKVEFLEKDSYQHSIASLSLSSPKDIYKKRVIFTPAEEELYEYEDPYSDDPD